MKTRLDEHVMNVGELREVQEHARVAA